mgnify:FL=1
MNTSTKKGKGLGEYMPLAFAAGIGSMLGSGIIVGLSATIVVWQEGLGLDTTQVGLLSGILTFAIAFGSLFGGRLADKIGRVLFFNWINLFYAIGAAHLRVRPELHRTADRPDHCRFGFRRGSAGFHDHRLP